jgi:hypothetical protein
LGLVYWNDFSVDFLDPQLGYRNQSGGRYPGDHLRIVLTILARPLLRHADLVTTNQSKSQVLWLYGGHTQFTLNNYVVDFACAVGVAEFPNPTQVS